MKPSRYFGVHVDGRHLYTVNSVPGHSVYGERLITLDDVEYRRWNPARSKLSALLHSGLETYIFDGSRDILYLGAATGTSVSHLSDIALDATIYSVEFSSTCFRKLSALSEYRENLMPVLDDANHPERYKPLVLDKVDIVYQDISQKNQVEILKKNCDVFCNPGAIAYFVLKIRSVDATGSAEGINKKVLRDLEKSNFEILEKLDISKYQRDHMVYVLRVG